MSDVARPDRCDETEILARRTQVARLYLNRRTQAEIARTLSCSIGTVCTDLAALRAEWKAESLDDIAATILRESAELDEMERDAALLFSQQKSPEWFDRRLKVKERRSKLLGLDQPTRADVTSGGMPLPVLSEIVVELPRIEEEEEPGPSTTAAPDEDAGDEEGVTWPTLREVVVELPE